MMQSFLSETNWLQPLLSNPQVSVPMIVMCVPIILGISYFWFQTRKVQSDNRLKRDMLDRGMSAQKIEQVLNAGRGTDDKSSDS